MKKELIQSIKIITLSLIIGLGVSIVYAWDWTEPPCSAPGCNTPAPVNVGPDAQNKTGDLTVRDASLIENGFISDGWSIITGNPDTGLPGASAGLYIGDESSPSTDVTLYKFSHKTGASNPSSATVSTSVPLCIDYYGKILPCEAPTGTVDLVLSETSYNQQYTNVSAPSASRSATLTWTVPSGASCIVGNQTETPAGTVTGWPVGYTINSSGSASVTFTRYGASTLTLTCDYGGGTPSDTVTYTYNGTDTFTSNGSFTVPTAVTSMTFKAVGGGGGGADAGDHANCNPDEFCVAVSVDGGSVDGTNTVIDGPGTTLDFTANKGTKGFECVDGWNNCPYIPEFYNGTPGNGSATNSPTVYAGSTYNSGGSSIGLSSYGNGGHGTGVRWGGGASAIEASNKTVTPGNSFSVTIGQGGSAAVDMLGVEAPGTDGVVQFSW